MGYTYEWKVTGVKKVNSENIDEAVVGTRWRVICTDEDGNKGEFNGATPFNLNTINTGSFTAYADLSEEQVLGWIKNVVSGSNRMTNYWKHIQGKMDEEIIRNKLAFTEVSDISLPWSPTSGSSVTPDPLHKDY
jgi:hypothetical protein